MKTSIACVFLSSLCLGCLRPAVECADGGCAESDAGAAVDAGNDGTAAGRLDVHGQTLTAYALGSNAQVLALATLPGADAALLAGSYDLAPPDFGQGSSGPNVGTGEPGLFVARTSLMH